MKWILLTMTFVLGCATSGWGRSARSFWRAITLPGARGAVSLDYIAFDRVNGKLWVPAGNTGSVDVYDVATRAVARIDGFPTVIDEHMGRKREVGPSSVTLGRGVAYVGNRANSEVCSIDMNTLKRGRCIRLASSPDGLAYVAATHEVWVTTPRENSISILDEALRPAGEIHLNGQPEGYAVDNTRGLFYTNLEDRDRTLAIDIHSRQVKASWNSDCGERGPRGIALDVARGFAFVACTNHAVVLDAGHKGAPLSKANTGSGVDNIDYMPGKQELFVAAGHAARLTVFHVGENADLKVTAVTKTTLGARTVVADSKGNAYVIDPGNGQVLVVPARR